MIKAVTRWIAISTLPTRASGVADKDVMKLEPTDSPYTAYPAMAIGRYRARIAERIQTVFIGHRLPTFYIIVK